MVLLTTNFIFNLEDILYVAVYDSEHIRIVYKNTDEKVFKIRFEDFYNALYEGYVR